MPKLPTSSERTDTALTLATTRAAAYADAGKMEMAYKALQRGVQSAQRVNNAGRIGTALAGLWAMPAVKAGVLGGVAAITAVVTRSKSKPMSDASKAASASGDPATSSMDSSVQRRNRFLRRSRKKSEVAESSPGVSGNLET
jgi:hypothetical protein